MAKHSIKKVNKHSPQAAIKSSTPDILNEEQLGDSPDSGRSKEWDGEKGEKYGNEPDSGPDGRQGRKKGSNLFLMPTIIILAVIAVLAWSWLALLSPDFSKKAEPYISKYFNFLQNILDRFPTHIV